MGRVVVPVLIPSQWTPLCPPHHNGSSGVPSRSENHRWQVQGEGEGEGGVAPQGPLGAPPPPPLGAWTAGLPTLHGYKVRGPQRSRWVGGLDKERSCSLLLLGIREQGLPGWGGQWGRAAPLSLGSGPGAHVGGRDQAHTGGQVGHEGRGSAAGWGSGHSSDSGVPARR